MSSNPAIHAIARKPHPSPHFYFEEFPGSMFYFLMQPVGIILEPYIIPHIPRCLGGGWIWVFIFTLITATPFRKQWVHDFRLIDEAYSRMSECDLFSITFLRELLDFWIAEFQVCWWVCLLIQYMCHYKVWIRALMVCGGAFEHMVDLCANLRRVSKHYVISRMLCSYRTEYVFRTDFF